MLITDGYKSPSAFIGSGSRVQSRLRPARRAVLAIARRLGGHAESDHPGRASFKARLHEHKRTDQLMELAPTQPEGEEPSTRANCSR